MITFTKQSPVTGQFNTYAFDLSNDEFAAAYAKWHNGALIQEAFPTLTPDEREFLISGCTPEDFSAVFDDE